uniref:Etoposide-induced protein 2.4-like protein n=1 Tax=Meloidogyne incognita TaxID=6306 RepID=A0A914LWD6_MELIC
MGGLTDILFSICAEYFRGLFCSLQGFLVLHKIDNPPVSSSVTEHRRQQQQKSTTSFQTVLEKRRQQELEKRCSKPPQTEQINKVSTPKRIIRCVCANIASVLLVLSIAFFVKFAGQNTLFSSFVSCLGSFVLIPVLIVVRLLSILWFADVAGAALRFRGQTGQKIPDYARAASDFVHAIIVELVFLFQAMLFFSINLPIISSSLGFVYMALLNSLYSFDYIWMSNGVNLNSRIALIERRWPFHLGFGTILTIATNYSSNFIISGCIFGALFPFFIVSSCLVDTEILSTLKGNNNKLNFPAIPFYCIAQNITNKLSLAIFGRFF